MEDYAHSLQEPSPRQAMAARRLLLLAAGVVLALLTYVGSYDVSGRESPCFEAEAELRREHPDAVEFRGAGGGWSLTHSCEALDANGTALGRVTYPGTTDWVWIVVMLIGPLTLNAAWRSYRVWRLRRQ